jgi:hypothetical protein
MTSNKTWQYLREILGPGLQWDKTQQELLSMINKAEDEGQKDAAEHLRIILARRNLVYMDKLTHR